MANKAATITAWEDADLDGSKNNQVTSNKGKKQCVAKSRYGYESLTDKYKFSHHSNMKSYIEEYRDMFSVANRTHKKGLKTNGNNYRFYHMPLTR